MHLAQLSAIRFGKKSVRIHVAINFLLLATCCGVLLTNAIISYSTQIYQLLNRPATQAQNGCNGHPSLCMRRYSEYTQVGTHGSAFVGIMPADNQNYNIRVQLDAGIRFLQIQTHKNHFGQLSLCHTHCMLQDAGLLSSYLATVKEWLDSHPQEVVTVLITTHDHFPMSAFDHAFNVSGAKPYVYIPPLKNLMKESLPHDAWPTLGELIGKGTRLITFMDYGAPNLVAPYILPQFFYFWETPFDSTDPAALSRCDIDRPAHLSTKLVATNETRKYNYIVNHYLDTEVGVVDIPNRRDTWRTNSWAGAGGIGQHVEACVERWGEGPAVVLVDYFEKGEVILAQNRMNGLLP